MYKIEIFINIDTKSHILYIQKIMKRLYYILGAGTTALASFAPTKAISVSSTSLERKLRGPPIINKKIEDNQYLKIKNILEERLNEIDLLYVQYDIRSRMQEIEENEDLNPETKDIILKTLNLTKRIYELATEDFMGGTI